MATGSDSRGFSLVELITVLVVAGVLVAVAAPRLSGSSAYDEMGFYEGTRALLRHAQKSAIAKRRLVCVSFPTPASVTVTFASAFGAATCDTNLIGPGGENPYVVAAVSTITYTPVPANFTFNPLGQPSAGQTVTISGGVRNIVINADTGYVQ